MFIHWKNLISIMYQSIICDILDQIQDPQDRTEYYGKIV